MKVSELQDLLNQATDPSVELSVKLSADRDGYYVTLHTDEEWVAEFEVTETED